jgi:hypothetical protein
MNILIWSKHNESPKLEVLFTLENSPTLGIFKHKIEAIMVILIHFIDMRRNITSIIISNDM